MSAPRSMSALPSYNSDTHELMSGRHNVWLSSQRVELLTGVTLTWGKSMLRQQQKNPWCWKTEQVHYFPWEHYQCISDQVYAVSFLVHFIQAYLDWACMTDCLKAWKWAAPSSWKWNMNVECDSHEIALADNGAPWCSVTVPSTFIMHEHVLKLT